LARFTLQDKCFCYDFFTTPTAQLQEEYNTFSSMSLTNTRRLGGTCTLVKLIQLVKAFFFQLDSDS
jgi:hypothetical protein